MQAAQLLVEVDQPGRDARKRSFALIRGQADDRLGRGLEEGHETAFGGALFGQRVKPLLGLGDLVLGVVLDLDGAGAVGNVLAQPDQFALTASS